MRAAGRLAPGGEFDPFQPGRVRGAGDPAGLGDGPAVDLLDVAGEVDRGGAADVRPHGERVDGRAGILEVADAVRVQPAGDHDLDVPVARLIEPRSNLVDQ